MSGADASHLPVPSLARASAILVGAGAVGSSVATYLVGAGLGRLGIVDSEPVEADTLRGEPLHWTPDTGAARADSVATKLGLMSEDALVEPYPVRLDAHNATAIVAGADVVLDCSGSEESHDLMTAACRDQALPLVTAEVQGAEALVLAAHLGRSGCWRCAAHTRGEPPRQLSGGGDERDAAGAGERGSPDGTGAGQAAPEDAVRAPLSGAAGSLQALAALTCLAGETTLLDTLLVLDGRDLSLRHISLSRRADCPACGDHGGQPQSS